MNSALIEKIKKLLALAQSEVPAERDAALAKAHSLATENKIDLALLDLSGVGKIVEEKFVQGEIEMQGRSRSAASRFIGWLLQSHFNVDLVFGHYTYFIGRTSDVEFAKWLWVYLREEFERRWDYYRRCELDRTEHPLHARKYRNTYMYGLYQGLDAKLKEERAETESRHIAAKASSAVGDARATDSILPVYTAEMMKSRYALAVVDETKKRKAAVSEFFPHLGRGRGMSSNHHRSSTVLSAGRAAGSSISTSRPLN